MVFFTKRGISNRDKRLLKSSIDTESSNSRVVLDVVGLVILPIKLAFVDVFFYSRVRTVCLVFFLSRFRDSRYARKGVSSFHISSPGQSCEKPMGEVFVVRAANGSVFLSG